MSIIRFPNSNFVRHIRLEDYDLKQSSTTRLNFDFDYNHITNPCYFTKVLQGTRWIQFYTDYETIVAYVVLDNGDGTETETDVTTSLSSGTVHADGSTQWQLTVNMSAYEGRYYFKFVFDQDQLKPIANYQSEWFEVAASFENHVELQWYNESCPPYNDGIVWSEPQIIYIDGRVLDIIPSVEKTVFTTENYKTKTTNSQPLDKGVWELELVPDYILKHLVIIMEHEYFLINGVRYNSEGTFEEVERQGDTRQYPLSINLNVVEDAQGNAYEDYNTNQEITGEIVPIVSFGLYAAEGAALFAETGAAIGYE